MATVQQETEGHVNVTIDPRGETYISGGKGGKLVADEYTNVQSALITVMVIGILGGVCIGIVAGTGGFKQAQTNDTYEAPLGALSCHKCYKPDCDDDAGVKAVCTDPAVSISAGDA